MNDQYINTEYAFILLDTIVRLGHPVDKLPPISQGPIMSIDNWSLLMQSCNEAVLNKKLSFEFGKNLAISTHGPLGHALKSAKNLRESLSTVKLFINSRTSQITVDLDEYETFFSYNHYFSVAEEIVPFIAESLLSMTQSWMKILGANKEVINKIVIHLTYKQPDYFDVYKNYLDFDIKFNQNVNALVAPKFLLDIPNPHYNEAIHNLALNQLELKKTGEEASIIQDVKRYLKQHYNNEPSLCAAAEHLHITDRTLKRKLAKVNVSFSELLREVRCNKAIDLLKNTTMSIEEIALLVGYSHASSFVSSFKNAKGTTPSAWRENNFR